MHFAILILTTFLALQQETHATGNRVTPTCKDDYFWCPTQKHHCNINMLKKNCKKTCQVCSTTTTASSTKCSREDCLALGCQDECSCDREGRMKCICLQGYKLNEDGKTCSDINECERKPNPCTNPRKPICRNIEGSYACLPCHLSPKYSNYYKSDNCCVKTNTTGCGHNSMTGVPMSSRLDAIVGKWPWTVLISVEGRKCTGVLISDEWILAPAHCFSAMREDDDNASIFAQFGIRSTNSRHQNSRSRQITIDQVIVHDDYNFPNNDVALAHLEAPVQTSWAVRPICLPNGQVPTENVKCWMSGFEEYFSHQGAIKMMVDSGVTILKDSSCYRPFGNKAGSANYYNMLCGSYDVPRQQHSCPGESGGALVCQRCDSCGWYVAGIMVTGDMCTSRSGNSKTSFLSVESYETWIERKSGIRVNKDGSCASTSSSWSDWNQWSACSRSCGGGVKERSRNCRKGLYKSSDCKGQNQQRQKCNSQTCPRWSDYGEWSECSSKCGRGTRKRTRNCINGSPGAQGCEGARTEIKECTRECGEWTGWSHWSECSASCGDGGSQTSRRKCFNRNGGPENCEGKDVKYRHCQQESCPSWSSWSSWTSCPHTCNENEESVSVRNCLSGNTCKGNRIRVKQCPTSDSCRQDCYGKRDRLSSSFCNRQKHWCTRFSNYMNKWCGKTCCETNRN